MTTPTNVVLLTLDTLRADHLSCYGYPRLTSPHLDRLAAEGTLFLDFISPHIPTHPGFTTMMTGRDVFEHGIVSHGGSRELDPAIPTLAELLAARGVYTAAVDNLGRWFTRGFDTYRPYDWDKSPTIPWRKAEVVNEVTLAALDACAATDRPFFLWAHYWDPHTPYLPPPPFDRMFFGGDERDPTNHSMEKVFAFEPFREYFEQWMGGVTDVAFPTAQYDAEIAYLDATLTHVFARLTTLGLDESTLVIVTSDHGEIMDEHVGYFDHHGLYEGNLRVPCILRWPGRIPAGRHLGGTTRMLDLAPTILDALGLGDVAIEQRLAGASLLSLAESGDNGGTVSQLYLTESTWMRKRGWRTAEWKLIEALEPDFHGGPELELYDRNADPDEQVNVADQRPDVVDELRARMHGHARRRTAETGRDDPIETGEITLRHIGKLETAVPADERLYADGGLDRGLRASTEPPKSPRRRPRRQS